LGFPYIFRGALDVRASQINEEMKLAAVRAIAALAKEPVPAEVNEAYGQRNMSFGRELIIPKPLDPRLISWVATAVAKAAIDSGVARLPIHDWDAYRQELEKRLGHDNKLIRGVTERASKFPKRVVFAEADNYKILKAAELAKDEGIAIPILLGEKDKINSLIKENNLDLGGVEIINPKEAKEEKRRAQFGEILYHKRQRKGMTLFEAKKFMRERNYFGAAMVEAGQADALVSGITRNYRRVIQPALQIIGLQSNVNKVAGMYILQTARGPVFFADTTVNQNPTAEELVDLTLMVAEAVSKFRITPHIAMLSYSNFGSADGPDAEKVRKAVAILHQKHPELNVDGEIQANFALNNEMLSETFPFSDLADKKVNTLIFPNLAAGNIAYKLLQELGEMEAIGPILLGMKKSFHILQMGCSVREILNMVRIAVVDAQTRDNVL
jgi:malate dehydrogenase (oxaloacetate-decarboxylating)(NADP+)